ncbi:hypothetical protein [Sphingomonas sp. Mn802worker]|uniref:hypothetical protein n=1 Tax=Sphingomonas sp. Mn802worker TaxID=629773 RepID=UPI000374F882|nr:hypothetical protein [Sphingomonas sp. Mn802worker]
MSAVTDSRNEAPTKGPSERANHRLLLWSGALGGLIGLGTALAALRDHAPGDAHPSLLSAPLPAWVALLIVVAWGVVLPVISWRWHRVVDEHEREAYRDGALLGFYVLTIGAPVWWFLWRGGMAPPVDPVAMFIAPLSAAGIVWIWRKYR